MNRRFQPRRIITTTLLLTLAGVGQAAAPDATILTTHALLTNPISIGYLTCGNTTLVGGCFAGGTLGPFGRIGALLEGTPSVSGNVVTRRIHVLDVASGGGAPIVLDTTNAVVVTGALF